jgi:phosphoglucosamine mutase
VSPVGETIMAKLFGTDGIRGTAGADLTVDLLREVGGGLAAACRDGVLGTPAERPRVVVGRDTRVSGPALQEAFVDGLTTAGADVLLGGVLPTAGVAFLTATSGADAGVVISASHNPPEDNGIKVFAPGGWKLETSAEQAIETSIGANITAQPGRVEDLPDAFDAYVAHLASVVSDNVSGMRVVIDCANGAASAVAPAALEKIGFDVIALNADGDGSRINEGCGALYPEVVCEVAKREGAIGLTLDGDADRVLVADEEGAIIDGDGILAVLARRMRSEGKLDGDGIAVTVMSNQALRRWCAGEGIKVHETAVGDRHVLGAMREFGLTLGGEQSGHIIRLDHARTGDGILVGASLLGIVASERSSLAALVPFRPLPQVLVNVPTRGAGALERSNEIREAVAEAERCIGDDGRVLVRASGTEPLVRVMIEAADREEAGRVAAFLAEAVKRELG